MICNKCLKDFTCLFTIPYNLQSIIPYIRLCSKCDSKERNEKIQRIEQLYKESPKQERITQSPIKIPNQCKHIKLTTVTYEELNQPLDEVHYLCLECGDTIYILDKQGFLPYQ